MRLILFGDNVHELPDLQNMHISLCLQLVALDFLQICTEFSEVKSCIFVRGVRSSVK
jgi:hypothetical protein